MELQRHIPWPSCIVFIRKFKFTKRDEIVILSDVYFAIHNGHGYFIGMPSELSSRMQTWLDEEAADAFNIMPALFPDGLNDFVDLVVPELQKNSLYKIRYEFKDLRLNLGLENSK